MPESMGSRSVSSRLRLSLITLRSSADELSTTRVRGEEGHQQRLEADQVAERDAAAR